MTPAHIGVTFARMASAAPPVAASRWRALAVAAVAAAVVLALWALHHLLAGVRADDVEEALAAIPPAALVASAALTAMSYLALTGYDVAALRAVGRPLPYRTAAFASFAGHALANNLGLALLTGGSARLRVYGAAGLPAADVARVVLLTSLTFWLGVAALLGAALLGEPGLAVPGVGVLPSWLRIPLGLAALGAAFAWLILCARGRPLTARGLALPLPSLRTGFAQLALGALDIAAASAALYLLAPPSSYPAFVAAYLVAIVAGVAVNAPGGLGVFEATMLLATPAADRAAMFSALIAYRAIYYLLPLAIAGVLLAAAEATAARRLLGRAGRIARRLAPPALAGLTFAGGVVLLLSGALPAIDSRIGTLNDFLPLPFIEASHLAGSLTGTALLILSPGLARRSDGAFHLTRGLLVAGALFSLAKGIDFEEAGVLSVILLALQAARPAFNRRSALLAGSPSLGWIVATLAALALSVWVGLFAYRDVAYDQSLWWQFAEGADASRFLRASLAAGVAAGAWVLWRLTGAPRNLAASPPPPGVLAAAINAASRTDAMLALTGDKQFLAGGGAAIAYQVQGRSWIACGDPIGPEGAWSDLLWRFRETAHAAQGRAVLYQLTLAALPAALDLGLQVVKLGEEARVDLAAFSLAGGAMRTVRQADARLLRDGATLEIIPAAGVAAILPELRRVSDEWLAAKGHAEKRFSVGRFDPSYLGRFDVAVVRLGGRIAAFANIWATANREELSVDLMRHADDAPPGVMDHLFAQLMLRGQAAGYRWFSLGIAPLAGLQARPLAPLFTRAGAFLFRRGADLYGFEGLRAYKNKFRPVWSPRYLAFPRGHLAPALLDATSLISGGSRSAAARAAPIDLPPAPPTGL